MVESALVRRRPQGRKSSTNARPMPSPAWKALRACSKALPSLFRPRESRVVSADTTRPSAFANCSCVPSGPIAFTPVSAAWKSAWEAQWSHHRTPWVGGTRTGCLPLGAVRADQASLMLPVYLYCVVARSERNALAYDNSGHLGRPEEASHGASLSGPAG